jgi:hypothetical protein
MHPWFALIVLCRTSLPLRFGIAPLGPDMRWAPAHWGCAQGDFRSDSPGWLARQLPHRTTVPYAEPMTLAWQAMLVVAWTTLPSGGRIFQACSFRWAFRSVLLS